MTLQIVLSFFFPEWSPNQFPGADLQHGTIETDRVCSALYNSFARKQTGFNKTHEMLACVSTTAASPRAMIEKDLPDSVWVGSGCTQANEISMSIFIFWAWATCDCTLEAFHTARNCLENTGIWGINTNRDVMHGFGTVGQRSKAFPFGFVAKKDRGKGFSVWAVQEMEQEPKKGKRLGGEGEGRKPFFLIPSPLSYSRHFSRGLWLSFVVLCSGTALKRLLRRLRYGVSRTFGL